MPQTSAVALPVPSSKRDRQLVAKGRSLARRKATDARDSVKEDGTVLAGSFFGQKFLGGMPTPMVPTIPLAYTLAGLNILFGIGGKGNFRSLVIGYAAGELGVRGRSQASNALSGIFGGGTPSP